MPLLTFYSSFHSLVMLSRLCHNCCQHTPTTAGATAASSCPTAITTTPPLPATNCPCFCNCGTANQERQGGGGAIKEGVGAEGQRGEEVVRAAASVAGSAAPAPKSSRKEEKAKNKNEKGHLGLLPVGKMFLFSPGPVNSTWRLA